MLNQGYKTPKKPRLHIFLLVNKLGKGSMISDGVEGEGCCNSGWRCQDEVWGDRTVRRVYTHAMQ